MATQLNMDLIYTYGKSLQLCTKHCKKLNLTQIKIHTKDFSVDFNPANSTEFAPFENLIKQILDETEVIL